MLIHSFSLVNARLLKAFGTAFYAIITILNRTDRSEQTVQTFRSSLMMVYTINMKLNDLRKIICLRKSEGYV